MANVSRRRSVTLAIVLLLAGSVAAVAVGRWWSERMWLERLDALPALDAAPAPVPAPVAAQVEAFCGDCHAVPRPASFARDAWYEEVRRGYRMYAQSGRTDLRPPPIEAVVQYYRSQAPAQVAFPQPPPAVSPWKVSFTVSTIGVDKLASSTPSVSHLRWWRPQDTAPASLVVSDLRNGWIAMLDPRQPQAACQRLAQLDNPCRFEPCDLDDDGLTDLLVADLGSAGAHDHDRGRVVWLRQRSAGQGWETRELVRGLGRVADVRAADLDGDGRRELVVAEFGLHRTGRLLLLKNSSSDPAAPAFAPVVLDPRPGYIHALPADVDADGKLDILALLSQENESVELFLPARTGGFQRRTLWRGPDLTFGVSGLEWTDLDGDGDHDIVVTNGDAFDNQMVTPWHGVQWFENRGSADFACHRLADLSGACRVTAGDFDGDGDTDLLVTAWLPVQIQPATLRSETLASLVALEQTAPGQFVRHDLKTGFPYYASIESADFDGDGDRDLALGVHAADRVRATDLIEIWWNTSRSGTGSEK